MVQTTSWGVIVPQQDASHPQIIGYNLDGGVSDKHSIHVMFK